MLKLAKRAVMGVAHGVGTVLGGIWLLFLLAVTIWISVGSLAAIQVRAKLAEDEKQLSFTHVQLAQDKYNAKFQQIFRRVDLADAQAVAFRSVDDKVRDIAGDLGFDPATINPIDFSNALEFARARDTCASPSTYETVKDIAADQDPTDAIKLIDGQIDAPNCALFQDYANLLTAAFAVDEADSNAAYEAAYDSAQKSLDELQTNEPLFQHFPTIDFFRLIGASSLLVVPSEVLVLVVTMAMGVLGGVVTMTWLFVRNDGSLTLRRFFTLPLIGAVSAFVVFIFVRAGQLTLTTGDAQDSLNPFVLSFVGVISGMLSERAYTRIVDVGTNFFRVDDGQPRWGSGIREAMTAAAVTDAEIARYLGISEEEAGRIVNESTTATLEQQRLISACLRRTVRELFTDVPPDAPSAVAAAPSVAVPDLLGLDGPALERALVDAGLRLGKAHEADDPSAAPGAVVGQSPLSGERLPRGGAVEVTLAARSAATDPAPADEPGPAS